MPKILFIVSILSQTLVFGAGLYMRRSLGTQMRLLIVYFGFDLIAELVMAYLGSQGMNNLWLVHVITIVQYCFLIAVFSLWQKNLTLKKILQASIPIIALMGIVSMLFFENIRHFNSYTKPVTSLMLVLASGYTLFELNNEKTASVFREPRFWIGSGTLFYFSSTLVLYSLSNVLLNFPPHVVRMIFACSIVINIITNIIYTQGFFMPNMASAILWTLIVGSAALLVLGIAFIATIIFSKKNNKLPKFDSYQQL